MNQTFSTRMTDLRTQRGISQKEAAAELGISQALLSHYEKGIRECGLDFLCRAAAYYDVSCDYLLGMIDTRRPFQEEFEAVDIEFDSEFRTSTLFRAATMLHDNYAESGSVKSEKVKQFFAFAIYRIAIAAAKAGYIPKSWLSLSLDAAAALSKAKMDLLSASVSDNPQQKPSKIIDEPLCVKTIITSAEKMLRKDAETVINSSRI